MSVPALLTHHHACLCKQIQLRSVSSAAVIIKCTYLSRLLLLSRRWWRSLDLERERLCLLLLPSLSLDLDLDLRGITAGSPVAQLMR